MAQRIKLTDREFAKQKNQLDLRHQKYLNYFNISAISLITIAFTSCWGFLADKVDITLLETVLFFDFLVFGSACTGLYLKMGGILEKIVRLK